MSQQQTPVLSQQQASHSAAQGIKSVPVPIDPNLLKQICGGTSSTSAPNNGGW